VKGSGKMRKKRLSKILIITLILAMILSNLTIYAAGPSSWAQAEVDEARLKNLVISDADSNYQGYITRELFCRLIVNMVEVTIGGPVTVTIANPFNDTNDLDIIKAYQLGIVNGVSATSFAPDDLITREAVAAMMMRAARKLDDLMGHNFTMIMLVGPPTFADLDQISAWALTDVHEANALGIMNGTGNNKISPKANTTIEQSILMTLRVFNEYLPLVENAAPETLAMYINTFFVNEGDSVDVQIVHLVYDPDGDPLSISGVGGNITYGNVVSYTDYITFTANEVDADQTSVWTVTITDGIESVSVPLTFKVINTNSAPVPEPMVTLHQDEGTSKLYSPYTLATDPDGDDLDVVAFELNDDPMYASAQHDVGTGSIITLFGVSSFWFASDWVTTSMWTYWDITITDGIHEVVVTIRIQVDNL